MIPIRDDVPSRRKPLVNVAIIVACTIVFLAQWRQAPDEPSLVERYGMIPARVLHPDEPVEVLDYEVVGRTPRGRTLARQIERPAAPAAVPAWLTLLTCIFLHGGWLHFLGNMWFLWIFGDNVEDALGRFGYVLFYLASGAGASLLHLATNAGSSVPTIGASGAIAGVMGAYLVLYPRAKVVTVVPLFVFLEIIVLPAPFFLGIWFLMQFFQGALAIGSTQSSGVAWWAHVGGFVVGFAVAAALRSRRKTRPAPEVFQPRAEGRRRVNWGRRPREW